MTHQTIESPVDPNILGELGFVLRRIGLWLLVLSASAALLAAWWLQRQPPQFLASQSFSLNPARVQYLSSVYKELPSQSTLLLGALEVDELARFSAVVDDEQSLQFLAQDAAFCQPACGRTAEDFVRYWRSRVLVDHQRRGNLLKVTVRAASAAEASQLLERLLAAAMTAEIQQKQQQSASQLQALDNAISQATTIGERSELSQMRDKAQALARLWQQPQYQAVTAVGSLHQASARQLKPWLGALLAGMFSALMGLAVAMLVVRR